MNLVFDEGFSPRLSTALRELEQGHDEGVVVKHITEVVERGTPDEEWIPKIASIHGIIISQDLNIAKTKALNSICDKHNLSLILFKQPKKRSHSYWEWVEVVISKWRTLKDRIKWERKRFILEITDRTIRNLSP